MSQEKLKQYQSEMGRLTEKLATVYSEMYETFMKAQDDGFYLDDEGPTEFGDLLPAALEETIPATLLVAEKWQKLSEK